MNLTNAKEINAAIAAAIINPPTLLADPPAEIVIDMDALNAAMAAAIEEIKPPAPIKVKKIVVSTKGNHDVCHFDGKPAPSKDAIKKLDINAGIVYLGRNSNKEKCVSCSPNAVAVHWMHVSFSQDDLMHNIWICESCKRAYPAKAGRANFGKLKALKK